MLLLMLFGCFDTPIEPQCLRIDVVPEQPRVYAQNSSIFDLTACNCTSDAVCADEDLVMGVSLDLSTTFGVLSSSKVYLPDGTGQVKLDGYGETGIATVTARAGSYSGENSVDFRTALPAENFVLSADAENLSVDGYLKLTVERSPSWEGQPVNIYRYPVQPYQDYNSQIAYLFDGKAEVLFFPPYSENNQTLFFYAQTSADYLVEGVSNTVEVQILGDTPFSVVPSAVQVSLGQTVVFRVDGTVSEPYWSVLGDAIVTCNGGSLEGCSGESEVGITVVEGCIDPYTEEPTSCDLVLRLTDNANGKQFNATISVD